MGSWVSDISFPADPDPAAPSRGSRAGGGKVKQLHTGNLHLFAIDDGGIWRRARSSVRLEPSLWEMLFEIARREAIDVNELARRVQTNLDPRLAPFADSGADPVGTPARAGPSVRPVNLSSGLRAFVACYFWRLSLRLETGDDPTDRREARLADALRYVSPAYLDSAQGEVRLRRAAQVRRGRPPRVRPVAPE